jgi:hypothetical protein
MDIKTEIPKESSGRLIDALTDIIRPFTEKRGLKGDQIRLQREEVLIEIAKRARMRAAVEQIDVQPVPLKVLIPLLEKASNEELDSPLLDWWANLLVTEATPGATSRPYFADLMSRLGPREARLLERLWNLFPLPDSDAIINTSVLLVTGNIRPDFEQAVDTALVIAKDSNEDKWQEKYASILNGTVAAFTGSWERHGVVFSGVRLRGKHGAMFWRSDLPFGEWISIDVCKALQVLEEATHYYEANAWDLSNKVHSLTWVTFSDLGLEFMAATHKPSPGKVLKRASKS